jgi:hypothetical protein
MERRGADSSTTRPVPEALPAAELEGSWKEAYNVLVDVMNALGWDELLEVP